MSNRVTAVEVARRGLCRMIATGELATGQLLPSEAELCERFGVSRSSLREAQKMLGVAGALSPRPGSRAAVAEMTPSDIMSGLGMVVPLLPLERFVEMLSMRAVLEGHLAALSAARLTDTEITRLAALAEELATVEDPDASQQLDRDFHDIIIEGAAEPMIAAVLDAIRRRGRDYRIFDDPAHAGLKAESDAAHRAIAAAMRAKDPERARALSTQHVLTTRSWLEGIRPGPTLSDSEPR
ncbi:MAG: FadR/GntR family transcriptional regulator [Propioniciclava sp.]